MPARRTAAGRGALFTAAAGSRRRPCSFPAAAFAPPKIPSDRRSL